MKGVYKIYFKNDLDKFYIGRTINYKSRISSHLHLLKKNKHHSSKLQEYYNSNKEHIAFELIHFIDDQDAQKRIEQSYLNKNPYFNNSKNAKGGKASPEGLIILKKIKELPFDDFLVELKKRIDGGCFYAIRYAMSFLYGKPKKYSQENKEKFINQWLTLQNNAQI